jgi:HlyD family secretion protein
MVRMDWARTAFWTGVIAIGAGLCVAACEAPVLPGSGNAPPAAVPLAQPTVTDRTSTSQSRPTINVRRGTVTEAIKVLGRVISSQEADLYFRTSGRLRGLFVETGQRVTIGQPLAELETGDLLTRIGKAKADLENAQIRLDQGRAREVIDDSAAELQAVEAAELSLRGARITLERLRSGATEKDIRDAEAAIANSRAGLEKARLDLTGREADLAARRNDLGIKRAGASQADIDKARTDVDAAQVRVSQASAGPRAEDIRTAELTLEKARVRLAQLRDTPPVRDEDLANAELTVRSAEVTADRVRADATGTNAQREAAVRIADIDVERARNTLKKLRAQVVNPWDLRLAEQDVMGAENAVARAKVTTPFEQQAAKIALESAKLRLVQMQAGPTEQDLAPIQNQIDALVVAIDAAKVAIPSAEAALRAAESRLAAVRRGPTEFDMKDAENRVEQATVAVELAKARLDAKRQSLESSRTALAYDLQSLERVHVRAELDLAQLEANYNDARILAPFDGKIVKTNGKPGDGVNAFNPVVSISSPAQLLVRSEVNESDMAKLAVGQKALIALDVFPGTVMNATVRDLPSTIVTQQGVVADKSTKLVVEWSRPGADIGMLARVQIVVQQRQDVLIVPTAAIRTVGKRRFIEYMDGTVKRSRNVEIGISTEQDTEIVSGVEEGLAILAGT